MTEHTKDCMFSSIDSFIATLDGVKTSLDEMFINLQDKTQEEIDRIIVEEINPTINSQLASLRSSLISSLQSMYQGTMKLIDKLTPVADSDPSSFSLTNLKAMIDFAVATKDFLIAMYETVMQFTVLLAQHLIELNSAIASLVAYTPPIQGLDFSKIDIKMESISIKDITG